MMTSIDRTRFEASRVARDAEVAADTSSRRRASVSFFFFVHEIADTLEAPSRRNHRRDLFIALRCENPTAGRTALLSARREFLMRRFWVNPGTRDQAA
jgi:hypothetical protein